MTDRLPFHARALDLFQSGCDLDTARRIASDEQSLGPPQANPFTCGGSLTSQELTTAGTTAARAPISPPVRFTGYDRGRI